MQADLFHEPYRENLVPELKKIRQIAQKEKALATYLSGAGPTVMTVIKAERSSAFIKHLQLSGLDGRLVHLKPDLHGAQVIK